MQLVSSAQNQEDIMLWRALRDVTEGFYVDVGAADPIELSVTRLFYDRGWHGINIEPNLAYHAALTAARPRDINLAIGAGREAGRAQFHDVEGTGLSTFDPEIAAQHQGTGWTVGKRTVDVLPLAEIFRTYRPEGPIHFLKIDVEGGEMDVLAGADFAAFRPWIVVVESTLPVSQVESHHRWEPLLTGQNYSFAWFDGLNRFYLADEMKSSLAQHFQVAPNIFDGFEPACRLLQRAEHAERSLTQLARNHAATCAALEDAQAATAEAHATLARTSAELAESRATLSAAGQELQTRAAELAEVTERYETAGKALEETRIALHAARKALFARTADLAAMTKRVGSAEAEMAALLASTSWRITAPIRVLRRLLPPRRAGARFPSVKQIGRSLFYRATRFALKAPGGQRVSRLIFTLAPAPVDWLARRYRAYDGRPDEKPAPPAPVAASTALSQLAAPPPLASDLSDGETRLYRLLESRGAMSSPL